MKLTKLKLALMLVGVLASSCALAQAKYIWVDEHGVKQFSDTPPPANIPDKNIVKQPHRTAPASASADAGSTSDNATKPAPSVADKEADYEKRRAEQATKDKKTAEDAAKEQTKAANCANAKRYQDQLNSGVRIQTVDQSGQRTFLDDSQRTQEAQNAQQAINTNCN